MRIVSCDAAFRAMQLRLISTLFTMASSRQLPIFIFTTSLATSLASSCRSASPGVFFSQRLPAPGSRLHCLDPPLHAAVSLGFAQKCLFGTYLGRFGRGSRLLPLPAMHAHSRLAVPAFAWIRLPWSRSNLVSGHGMTQVSVHERIVSSACRMPWNQGGMGACMCVFETHQKVVCLDLLDGNAKAIKAGWTCKCIPRRIRKWFVSACWMGTHGRSRRDGGLHMS